VTNLPVPNPRTAIAGEFETAAYFNMYRDAINFLLNRPAAVLYQTAAQSVPNTGPVALQFNQSQSDTYGGHSNSTNNTRYTAQVAGTYWVVANGLLVSATGGDRSLQIYKNGTGLSTSFIVDPAASTAYGAMGTLTATQVQLAVGEYVEAWIGQNTSGALNTYVANPYSSMQLWWMHA
jgi:hypothetical protein